MKPRATHRLMLWSAGAGALAWLALAWGAGLSPYEYMYLLAPLVIVPLSLALLLRGSERPQWLLVGACFLQPAAACLVALSFGLDAGSTAGILTLLWLAFCGLIALAGLLRFRPAWRDAITSAGMMYLAVGGLALALSRAGIAPPGLAEPIVLLTAVHFHFTGFALPVFVSVLAESLPFSPPQRRTHTIASITLIAATPLLGVGWALDSAGWKLVCVLALVASLSLIATLTLAVARKAERLLPRMLLAVSAVSVLLGMVLAGVYAAGEFAGHSLIDLHQMARWHGATNGIGFTLCGLLAMNLTWQEEASA